jgi:hypothetical protein
MQMKLFEIAVARLYYAAFDVVYVAPLGLQSQIRDVQTR